jgi:hypothetical protein
MIVSSGDRAMVTEGELHKVAKEHRDVGLAYEKAVNACITLLAEKSRYDAEPGLSAETRVRRRQSDAAHLASVFLKSYCGVTGHVAEASDTDIVTNVIVKKAKLLMLSPEQQDKEFVRGLLELHGETKLH